MSYFKWILFSFLMTWSYTIFSLETSLYIDTDKDRIIILDKSIQNKLAAIPEMKTSTLYDDPKQVAEFNKYLSKDIFLLEKKYQYYTVQEGDTLEGISLKIFKSKYHSDELLELNEDIILKNGLKKDLILKYIDLKK